MMSFKPGILSLFLPVPVLLAGCAAVDRDVANRYEVPAGTRIELTRAVELPFRSARVYIQGGRTLAWSEVNRYAPYCSFGLNRERNGEALATSIGPTVFEVRDSRVGVQAGLDALPERQPGYLTERSVFTGEAVRVASEGGRGGGGTPWPYNYYTVIEIYSADAPQVDDLTCAFDGAPRDDNLTLDRIRGTLEDLVLLRS